MVIAHSHTLICMPELPEVERARALIAERALGRRIARVDDTDAYVTRPHTAGEIAAALTGRELTAAHRRGNHVDRDRRRRGPTLGLHLAWPGGSSSTTPTPSDLLTTGLGRHGAVLGPLHPAISRTAAGSSCATAPPRPRRARPRFDLLGPDAPTSPA